MTPLLLRFALWVLPLSFQTPPGILEDQGLRVELHATVTEGGDQAVKVTIETRPALFERTELDGHAYLPNLRTLYLLSVADDGTVDAGSAAPVSIESTENNGTLFVARTLLRDIDGRKTAAILLESQGNRSFYVYHRAPDAIFDPKSVKATTASDWGLGRFRFGLLAGIEFSQEEKNFSQQDLYIRFWGDTTWRSNPLELPNGGRTGFAWDPENLHTGISLILESIPDVQGTNDFTTSEKALTLEGVLDYRLAGWGLKPVQENAPFDWLSLGLVGKAGIQSISDVPVDQGEDNLDKVNHYSCVGLRIAEQQIWPGRANEPVFRYLDITGGNYENLPGLRWMLEGVLRANLSGDPDSPVHWFIGFKGNLGEGPDDIRIFIGTDNALGYLKGLFNGLAGLFDPKGTG